ncbi:hypothetical protein RUM43_006523 [Polyplax serrata]|uniref:Uncharacterized protein n=1 Tax=Polyplax serrata TaxID=468196 RepID=A0AAN8RVH0_POLSC
MAKTGTANFVGKLFFNVVQTKCFVLKPKEIENGKSRDEFWKLRRFFYGAFIDGESRLPELSSWDDTVLTTGNRRVWVKVDYPASRFFKVG